MLTLCRLAAEIDRQANKEKTKREGTTRDPRDPREVLVAEGIEPHPGPEIRRSEERKHWARSKNGLWPIVLACLLTVRSAHCFEMYSCQQEKGKEIGEPLLHWWALRGDHRAEGATKE